MFPCAPGAGKQSTPAGSAGYTEVIVLLYEGKLLYTLPVTYIEALASHSIVGYGEDPVSHKY